LHPSWANECQEPHAGHGSHGVTRVALALRIHFLEHGHYPASLAGLAPTILAGVPLDPCSGEAPIYERPEPDRCRVRSVGLGMREDVARRHLCFPRNQDWPEDM